MYVPKCLTEYKTIKENYVYRNMIILISVSSHEIEICEGEEKVISCVGDERLYIVSSIYGAGSATSCPRNTNGKLCFEKLNTVRYSCNEKLSCTLKASSSEFSDPCNGNAEYLKVSYRCIGKCQRSHFHCSPRNCDNCALLTGSYNFTTQSKKVDDTYFLMLKGIGQIVTVYRCKINK